MSAQQEIRSMGEPQILLDEPVEVYYKRSPDVANFTGLKIIDGRSPAHFKYYVENPDENDDTPAKVFGRAFHSAVLEPNAFTRSYVVLPPDAPQRPTQAMLNAKNPSADSLARQAWWERWRDIAGKRIIMKSDDYDRAQRMGDAVRSHPVASGLIVGGDREVTFRWTDPRTGLACKARIDNNVPNEFMLDLKSCVDASREGFARAVASYRYDMQQAHYVAGAKECGSPVKRYIVLACESDPPYVCQPYILDAMAEERGWAIRERAMSKQAECLATGKWPGYSGTVEEIALPTWAFYGTDM